MYTISLNGNKRKSERSCRWPSSVVGRRSSVVGRSNFDDERTTNERRTNERTNESNERTTTTTTRQRTSLRPTQQRHTHCAQCHARCTNVVTESHRRLCYSARSLCHRAASAFVVGGSCWLGHWFVHGCGVTEVARTLEECRSVALCCFVLDCNGLVCDEMTLVLVLVTLVVFNLVRSPALSVLSSPFTWLRHVVTLSHRARPGFDTHCLNTFAFLPNLPQRSWCVKGRLPRALRVASLPCEQLEVYRS